MHTHTHTHIHTCVAANTGLLTTFRSDNINGIGSGALVFAYAFPCGLKRSADQLQALSAWHLHTNTCQEDAFSCRNRACDKLQVSGLKCTKYLSTAKHTCMLHMRVPAPVCIPYVCTYISVMCGRRLLSYSMQEPLVSPIKCINSHSPAFSFS